MMHVKLKSNNRGFTFLEIMVVVLVIGILLGIAVPNMQKARGKGATASCRENLRMIQMSKERWALENNQPSDATPTWDDIVPIYLKGNQPSCALRGEYEIGSLDVDPTCSIEGHSIESP